MGMRQARYWILTIPEHEFVPFDIGQIKNTGIDYIGGQREIGETGYHHWQLICHFSKKHSLLGVKRIFGDQAHAEPTRSEAARDYCFKEDTYAADGSRFEFGNKPFNHSDPKDWERVWEQAKIGDFEKIIPDVRVRCYNAISKIRYDNLNPKATEKNVRVFWGRSGTGKTRRAAEEAGDDAYWKTPHTSWWCGYRSQQSVILDDFRGKIEFEYMLRILDRYPLSVEVKGGSRPFAATDIWITSNINPNDWYPALDEESRIALRRRFTNVTHFDTFQ